MPNPRDINDIPAYEANACPHCQDWQKNCRLATGEHLCQSCQAEIPHYAEMKGNGYQSPLIHHAHYGMKLVKRNGDLVVGRRVICRELCLECYQRDYLEQFGALPEMRPPQKGPARRDLEERIAELEALLARQRLVVQ